MRVCTALSGQRNYPGDGNATERQKSRQGSITRHIADKSAHVDPMITGPVTHATLSALTAQD